MKKRKLFTTLVLVVAMLASMYVPSIQTSAADHVHDHVAIVDCRSVGEEGHERGAKCSYCEDINWTKWGVFPHSVTPTDEVRSKDDGTHEVMYKCSECDYSYWGDAVPCDFDYFYNQGDGVNTHLPMKVCSACQYETSAGDRVDCSFILYEDAYGYEEYSDVHYEMWYCEDYCTNYYYVEKPHEFVGGVCIVCGYEYKERPVAVTEAPKAKTEVEKAEEQLKEVLANELLQAATQESPVVVNLDLIKSNLLRESLMETIAQTTNVAVNISVSETSSVVISSDTFKGATIEPGAVILTVMDQNKVADVFKEQIKDAAIPQNVEFVVMNPIKGATVDNKIVIFSYFGTEHAGEMTGFKVATGNGEFVQIAASPVYENGYAAYEIPALGFVGYAQLAN